LPSFCRGGEGCPDCEGGGWGADMVLEKRDVGREAHAVLGARTSRSGYWMQRGMPRGENNGDDIVSIYWTIEGEGKATVKVIE
jgi:hypothetical protein